MGIRTGGPRSQALDVCGSDSGAGRRDRLANISGAPGCSPWTPAESPRRRPPSDGQGQAWRRTACLSTAESLVEAWRGACGRQPR